MPVDIFKITSAGSVDDGKSTILARLLLDTGSIYEDHLGSNFDPQKIADLLDGLESERQQGITIDVAHRFLDSESRRYQIADSPGHEQFTRNMATACAGSNALLLVVDVTAGLKKQTLHHLEIALRFGIKQIIIAANKMDLAGYRRKAFEALSKEIHAHISSTEASWDEVSYKIIPVSGLEGANVVRRSSKMNWYSGPTLLEAMDSLSRNEGLDSKSKMTSGFQIQYVQRIPGGGRRYLGPLLVGNLEVGQTLFTSSEGVKVNRILSNGAEVVSAEEGEQVSVELASDLDLQRGQLLSSEKLEPANLFEIDLIWLSNAPGHKSHTYIIRTGSGIVKGSITRIHKIDPITNHKMGEIHRLDVNQIVRATIATAEPLTMLPYEQMPKAGGLILVDPNNGQTVGVGMVNFALRRSSNITRQNYDVSQLMSSSLTGNRPKVIWFTGLSGSGKSTLANELSSELFEQGKPHAVLDGDNLRLGLNRDLGFTAEERTENIRRTAEVAKLMLDAGLIVIAALVSPSEQDRQMAKAIIGKENFTLIFVDTPIEICESRDPKGLYKKARIGNLPNFTGIFSEYQPPVEADFVVSNQSTLQECNWQFWLE